MTLSVSIYSNSNFGYDLGVQFLNNSNDFEVQKHKKTKNSTFSSWEDIMLSDKFQTILQDNDHSQHVGVTEAIGDFGVGFTASNHKLENSVTASDNFWIGDADASHHMCRSSVGFFNKISNLSIKMGVGSTVGVQYIGYIKGEVLDENGDCYSVIINNVSYVPALKYNLFRTTKTIDSGM